MRITFLGTCSGTEPIRGARHVSFTLEREGDIYLFDAGESCSYSAHLLGIDLLKTRAIFISHCHMDHIGGLPNYLWTINKLDGISRENPSPMSGKQIDVFMPNEQSWIGVKTILENTQGGFNKAFSISMNLPEEGIIFKEKGLAVYALPNAHEKNVNGRALSFSYRIETDGKSVVFSGDVKDISELQPFLEDCSILLMETGHHKVEDICRFIKENTPGVERLFFIHHGVALLADPESELAKARRILGDRVFIARDGMALDL